MTDTTKTSANAAQVVLDANREAVVGFDAHVVAESFRAMSEKRDLIDATTGEMQSAAVSLIRHAHDVAEQSAAAGATEIEKGWSASVRAMLPMLAKEGSKFVKASEKKDGGFVLTGYGQNVNSVARGFCMYPDLDPDECSNDDGQVTYGSLYAALAERKRQDESDDERALRLARESLAEALKEYRKAAVKGNDAERINSFAEALIAAITEPEQTDDDDDTETETEAAAA